MKPLLLLFALQAAQLACCQVVSKPDLAKTGKSPARGSPIIVFIAPPVKGQFEHNHHKFGKGTHGTTTTTTEQPEHEEGSGEDPEHPEPGPADPSESPAEESSDQPVDPDTLTSDTPEEEKHHHKHHHEHDHDWEKLKNITNRPNKIYHHSFLLKKNWTAILLVPNNNTLSRIGGDDGSSEDSEDSGDGNSGKDDTDKKDDSAQTSDEEGDDEPDRSKYIPECPADPKWYKEFSNSMGKLEKYFQGTTAPPIVHKERPMAGAKRRKREAEKAQTHVNAPVMQLGEKNSATKCDLGKSAHTKCPTWSVNLVIALKQGSSNEDLKSIKAFVKDINSNCDSDTEISVFSPQHPNSECASFTSKDAKSNLDSLGAVENYEVGSPASTYFTLNKLYGNLLNCSVNDTDKLGGLTIIFSNSDCTDFCKPNGFTTKREATNEQWIRIFTSGIWDATKCNTTRNDVFESIVGKCDPDEKNPAGEICHIQPISDFKSLSSFEADNQTCPSNGLTTTMLLLIIGLPCLTMIIIALGCAFFCYKKSNVRWRKFFLREQLQNRPLNAAEIKRHNDSLKHKGSGSIDGSFQGNHYSSDPAFKLGLSRIDEWEIPSGHLLVIESKVLGHGAFATVYRGVLSGTVPLLDMNPTLKLDLGLDKEDECEVAVKRLPPHADPYAKADFEQEIQFMKSLGYHRHVASLLGCVTTTPEPLIVLEFCHYGDLLRFLRSKKKHHVLLSEDEECPIEADMCLRVKDLVSIAWQIADGMSYLSSMKFIHRDLAARNILLTKSLVAKVSDFGLGRHVDSTLYMAKGGRLPIKWMPPEALKYNEFSQKSDVWSFGILLYEVFSLGKTPLPTIQPTDIIGYLEGGGRPCQPLLCPLQVYSLMQLCWELEPEKRPCFEELKKMMTSMLNTNDQHYGYIDLECVQDGVVELDSDIPGFEEQARRARSRSKVDVIDEAEDEGDEVDDDEGDGVDWVYLGRRNRSLSYNEGSSPSMLSVASSPIQKSNSTMLFCEKKKECLERQRALDAEDEDVVGFTIDVPPARLRSVSFGVDVEAVVDLNNCHHKEEDKRMSLAFPFVGASGGTLPKGGLFGIGKTST